MIGLWLAMLAGVGTTDPCRPADAADVARRFATLDAYLAAREKAGHTDAAFYKRLPDGRYACVITPKPSKPPPVFTREELARAYGFQRR